MSKQKQSVSGTKTAARVLLAAVFVLLTAVCVFAGAGAAETPAISLSAEEVTVGSEFTAIVTGIQGVEYTVAVQRNIISIPNQGAVTVNENEAVFTMPESGTFNLTLKAEKKYNDATVILNRGEVREDDASLKILDVSPDILYGILTVCTTKGLYTLGDDIKFEGTYTSNKTLYFYIEGVNCVFTQIMKKNGEPFTATGKEEWNATLTFNDLVSGLEHYLDAGIYTFYVSTVNGSEIEPEPVSESALKEAVTSGLCENVAVQLKQAFIAITNAPAVIPHGETIVVEGTADAAKSVIWYLFGPDYFEAGVQNVKDDEFTITIDEKWTKSEYMGTGQYFMIVQHPMYDSLYSIAPEKMDGLWSGEGTFDLSQHPENILKNDKYGFKNGESGVYKSSTGVLTKADGYDAATPLFSMSPRQTANAAQALCDALDSQNFDDMYVKTSFFVGESQSIINPIPEIVTQGEVFTIFGETTGHKGDRVSVDFLPTAFAEVSEQAVEAGAYMSLITLVQNDGRWAVEVDTSYLQCGEYTVSVTVGSLAPSSPRKITIVKEPVTKTTYTLTDSRSVSGGPLQILGKELVVHDTAVPTVAPTTAPTVAPTVAPGQGGTVFETGDYVTASLSIRVPHDSFTDGDKIYFETDLLTPSCTVAVETRGGVPLLIKNLTLTTPVNYITGYDVSYGDTDVVLDITLSGYIPAGTPDELQVMHVFTTATGGTGVKSYEVLMTPGQLPPVYEDSFTLQSGWNFISVPKKLAAENDTAGELFAGVNTGGKAILSYNAQTKQWEGATDSTDILPLNAYWIYSTEKHALNPAFDTAPSAPAVKNVYTGWNAVGASAEEPIAANAAFTRVNWRSYTLWNADSQKYGTIYIKGGTGKYSDEQSIPLYKGGWLYMDGDGTINGYA